jgi:hypothetical protein
LAWSSCPFFLPRGAPDAPGENWRVACAARRRAARRPAIVPSDCYCPRVGGSNRCKKIPQNYGVVYSFFSGSVFAELAFRRMERAKALLKNPTLTVTEIGLMLGFSEASSFTAAFRRLVGTTPSNYRRGGV